MQAWIRGFTFLKRTPGPGTAPTFLQGHDLCRLVKVLRRHGKAAAVRCVVFCPSQANEDKWPSISTAADMLTWSSPFKLCLLISYGLGNQMAKLVKTMYWVRSVRLQ